MSIDDGKTRFSFYQTNHEETVCHVSTEQPSQTNSTFLSKIWGDSSYIKHSKADFVKCENPNETEVSRVSLNLGINDWVRTQIATKLTFELNGFEKVQIAKIKPWYVLGSRRIKVVLKDANDIISMPIGTFNLENQLWETVYSAGSEIPSWEEFLVENTDHLYFSFRLVSDKKYIKDFARGLEITSQNNLSTEEDLFETFVETRISHLKTLNEIAEPLNVWKKK